MGDLPRGIDVRKGDGLPGRDVIQAGRSLAFGAKQTARGGGLARLAGGVFGVDGAGDERLGVDQ